MCESAPAAKYQLIIEQLEKAAAAEVKQGVMSGVSIALVVDQEVIYVGGFGSADKKRGLPSSPNTVYRAGSISKLFTALAAMQLAEQGKVDIDHSVTDYNAAFRIINPFTNTAPVTLRQLMCHRSGLVRESPVGGYFDDREPSVDASVDSIAGCVLVYPPGTATKYSNIGVTVVGQTVERIVGQPFQRHQETKFFRPLGMTNSSFILNASVKRALAKGYMLVAEEKGGFHEIEAPLFELGTIPAGNLYTTVADLGRFLSFLFAQGRSGDDQLLQAKTLEAMFTPQLTKDKSGFGLGFHVGDHKGRKKISHTGAVYGFTSALTGLPAEKIGVVVLCNDDLATGPVIKLNNLALDLLLGSRAGKSDSDNKGTEDVRRSDAPPEGVESLAGDYESESYWARIDVVDGKVRAVVSGQPMELRRTSEARNFEAHGRFVYESPFVFKFGSTNSAGQFSALGQTFQRVRAQADNAPEIWQQFVGSYGPAFIPLLISIRHGHLYAMTENMFDYRLTPLNRTVYKMPPGLYTDEQLIFQMDKAGRVHGAVLANMSLPRRTR